MTLNTTHHDLRIREAIAQDMPAILNMMNYHIENTTVNYNESKLSLQDQESCFAKKHKEGMPVIVAESGNRVLGFATYGIFRPFDGYRYSVEHSVYVVPDRQSQGVGKALMRELIAIAKKQGHHTMIAGVTVGNPASIRFHEHLGFEKVGYFKEVGTKFDQWLDLVFLQLMLES